MEKLIKVPVSSCPYDQSAPSEESDIIDESCNPFLLYVSTLHTISKQKETNPESFSFRVILTIISTRQKLTHLNNLQHVNDL